MRRLIRVFAGHTGHFVDFVMQHVAAHLLFMDSSIIAYWVSSFPILGVSDLGGGDYLETPVFEAKSQDSDQVPHSPILAL